MAAAAIASIGKHKKSVFAALSKTDLIQLPPEEARKKDGLVEKRAITATGVWHKRRLVLTEDYFCIARESSNDVLDQIPLTSIQVVILTKNSHSIFKNNFSFADSSREGNRPPFERTTCSQEGVDSEANTSPLQRAEQKQNCFEVQTKHEGFRNSRKWVPRTETHAVHAVLVGANEKRAGITSEQKLRMSAASGAMRSTKRAKRRGSWQTSGTSGSRYAY